MKLYPFLLASTFLFFFSNFSKAQKPTISVAPDKMNVLYIGLDNPLTIAVEGISNENVHVKSEDLMIENKGNGKYNARATKPGTYFIRVEPDGAEGQSIPFRVKRIPDPVAHLGSSRGGAMSVAEFKAQVGIMAMLYNFDFDAKCSTVSYVATFVRKGEDVIEYQNKGAKFSKELRAHIDRVKPGDVIYFDMILAKCPGDMASRKINAMVFKII